MAARHTQSIETRAEKCRFRKASPASAAAAAARMRKTADKALSERTAAALAGGTRGN